MSGKQIFRMPIFGRALHSRFFALLWIGQTISILGDSVFFIALVWQVLLSTHSAVSLGIIQGAQTIPSLFFLLLGGVAADRLPRRLILLCSDSARAIITLLLAGLGWLHLLQFWHFVALAFFFGIVDGFFMPTSQAILPQLVKSDDLPSANGLLTLSQRLCLFAGPLVGTGIIIWGGPGAAFAFDGLTFLFSAACFFMIRFPVMIVTRESKENTQPASPIKSVIRDLTEGFQFIRGERWLWVSMLVGVIGSISLAGSFGASQPKLIHDFYGTGVSLLGLLVAMTSLGVVLATLVVSQFPRLHRRGVLSNLGTMILGISVITLGLPIVRSNPVVIASIASTTYGFGMGFSGLIWSTVIQEYIPQEKLGRVSSVQILCTFSMIPLGLVIGGIATDHIGPGPVFVICGLLNVVIAGVALAVKDIRQLS